MRLHFRPFLGLTLFTVMALAILIGLGNWQCQRLQWKTALLEDVEQAITAPPMQSLADVSTALELDTPVDFRRISFTASLLPGQRPYLVYSRDRRRLMWRPYYAVEESLTGARNFAAVAPISDDIRNSIEPILNVNSRQFSGYVRLWRKAERGSAESTPALNRWFGFNPLPDTASWSVGRDSIFSEAVIDTRFYIDVVAEAGSAEELPIKRPDIRNNHLDYMLTWYGLAVALFVIYLILHMQRGRLSFKEA